MRIAGEFWQDKDGLWVIEIPILNLVTQAEKENEIAEMVKDAIEVLINDEAFNVDVAISDNMVFIKANNPKKLVALIFKRQRMAMSLTLEKVAALLNAKSINEYAQYEQGKHLPSIEKINEFLEAINPDLQPFISCRK